MPHAATIHGLETMSVLVVSTAHMTKADARRIRDGEAGEIASDVYGHFVWTESDAPYPLSDAFNGVITFAADNGYGYVRFDRDGPACEHFPTFDW